MKPLFRAFGIFVTALTISTAAGASANIDTQARVLWHQDIAAGYQNLAKQTRALAEQADSWCQEPAALNRDSVDQLWLDSFRAWQAVRFVDFGPIETDNRAWQFQFWPDPKNLIARKARYLLTSDQAPTAGTIADSGVAVQGFPMAEYLLFDEQLNSTDRALPAQRTCRALVLVAGHIADNSAQQLQDWQAFEDAYVANEQYRDTTIKAGMAALEILEERRMAQPMGLRGTGKRSVYTADAWRSGQSLAAIEATVRGLQEHFLPGLVLLLELSDQPELAGRIEQQFIEVLKNFPAMRTPMAPLLSNDEAFARLQGLYVDISQLTNLVNDQAAVALGVVRGFNSSDGD
ncbi:MAG: imelysin family protein [Marinobacter sp.]|nr:imelysin family protein [Marinobacter sp.]